MSWLDHLIDLVCQLLEVLGGNCDELDQHTAEAIIDEIARLHDPDNPPVPDSNAQKAAWCALLAQITAHLDLPENNLPPATDAKLRAVVTGLRGDLACP